MGTSNPKYFGDHLQGDLSDDACKKLIFLRRAFAENKGIEGLEHLIYDLPSDEVDKIIDMRGRYTPSDFPQGTLRNYQTVGPVFMYYSRHCLIGDSVGLGKTAQVAAFIRLVAQQEGKTPNVLFLSEKKPAPSMQRELIRFTGEHFHRVSGESDDIMGFVNEYSGSYPNLVATHASLRNNLFQSWLLAGSNIGRFPYDILVFDESSTLGNSSTAIYKIAKKLFQNVKFFIMLNATPFENNLDTFYNQLNLLDPKMLPTKKDFESRFKKMSYNGFYKQFTGKYRNAEEFQTMVELRYLPRTRESLGATFENCHAYDIVVPLTVGQKRLLKDVYQYRMVYDAPWVLDAELPTTCPKIETMVRMLTESDLRGKQVLVYCHFKEAQSVLVDRLNFEGVSTKLLNGDTPELEAQEIISGFQNKEFSVLVTNVQKSLNFGDVNHCIFYSYNPNPNKMAQFEGRFTRSFDIKDKNVYILLSEGKEYDTFYGVVADRARASENFAGSDFSMILTLLKGSNS